MDAGVPGIAVVVQPPDDGEFLSLGVGSLETEQPITSDDHWRIASVTKAFTAAMVMQLVEEGELALDETAEQAAPGLIAEGGRVTIEQLLAHTSGLPDYVKDERFAELIQAAKPLTPERVLGLVAEKPLEFEPGSEYGYSDTDNIVLGMIIEQVTGSSYEQELRSRIIEPLGLSETTLATEIGQFPEPHVDGYQFDPEAGQGAPPENVTDAPIDPNGAWASGALVSTPRDVATFFRALLGGELVGSEQLEEMMRTVPGGGDPNGPGENNAGLGIFSWTVSCGEVWGHTGAFPGFRSLGAASDDGDASLAVMVNATEVPDEAEEKILEAQEEAICWALGEAE